MNNERRLALWERLREQELPLPLHPIRAIALGIRTERLGTPESLEAAIAASGPREGWITFQSASHAFLDGDWQRGANEAGLALSGEWVGEAGSCALARAETGWVVTTFEPGGDDFWLCDDVRLLATRELGYARYRRLWKDEPGIEDPAPVPWAMQFLGFGKEEHPA